MTTRDIRILKFATFLTMHGGQPEDSAAKRFLVRLAAVDDPELAFALGPFIWAVIKCDPANFDSIFLWPYGQWQELLLKWAKIVSSSGSARSPEAEQFLAENATDQTFGKMSRLIQALMDACPRRSAGAAFPAIDAGFQNLIWNFANLAIEKGTSYPIVLETLHVWNWAGDEIPDNLIERVAELNRQCQSILSFAQALEPKV